MSLYATTSHTVGPYYHIGLTWLNREALANAATLGERVAISGQVVDGNGDVVNDAMPEGWQATPPPRPPPAGLIPTWACPG